MIFNELCLESDFTQVKVTAISDTLYNFAMLICCGVLFKKKKKKTIEVKRKNFTNILNQISNILVAAKVHLIFDSIIILNQHYQMEAFSSTYLNAGSNPI